MFNLEADNPFEKTIAMEAPQRVKLAQQRLLEDAGGTLPEYPMKGTERVRAPFI